MTLEDPTRPLIIGYRCWRISVSKGSDPFHLMSLFTRSRWPLIQPVMASCLPIPGNATRTPHGADYLVPAFDCSCGIYAYHHPEQMLQMLDLKNNICGGSIVCWGRVIVHDTGVRAQYARLLALCLPASDCCSSSELLQRVAAAYRVPVLRPSRMVAFATEFGESAASTD